MTKTLLITAAAFSAALQAQTSYFQTPSWMNAPLGGMSMHPPVAEGQVGPIKGKPFSGTEVRNSSATLSDGSPVRKTDSSRIYRDAEGRMRDESDLRAMIFDPVAGVIYSINLKLKTYTKIPSTSGTTSIAVSGETTSYSYSGSPAKPGGNSPNAKLITTEDLGYSMLNGVSVKGSRATLTIPANTFGNERELKVVNERWYSDDLGILVKSSNTDPRFGNTTYELTNISQATPDASLFEAPRGFTLKEAASGPR